MVASLSRHTPSLAAETRNAIRERPFIVGALRAGVVNDAAATVYSLPA